MENIRNILLLATLLFGGVYVADSAHTGRRGEGRSVDSPSSMTLFNLIKNTEKAVTKKCVFDDNCLIDNKMKENTTQQDQDSVTVNKHSAKSVFERSGDMTCYGVMGVSDMRMAVDSLKEKHCIAFSNIFFNTKWNPKLLVTFVDDVCGLIILQ